jgi:hydrogenase nickel incorporation protein HypA/HybF
VRQKIFFIPVSLPEIVRGINIMHEFSLALNIIDIASETASQANADTISSVEIEVGSLSGVIIEALEFALDTAKENTILKSSEIHITSLPAEAICRQCKKEFVPESFYAPCPQCGSFNFDIIRGKELKVKSITVDNG